MVFSNILLDAFKARQFTATQPSPQSRLPGDSHAYRETLAVVASAVPAAGPGPSSHCPVIMKYCIGGSVGEIPGRDGR
ncbi:MAG: hypothetical protein BMS9Abin10_0971 [Gammaproteobacteria bacterium]|nr:MAG: hypothetical protein BMS9Abin10_0971 [Gammaproteobacteria bacterium]